MFEIKERDALGRICKLYTKHGVITTPTVLPVINPHYMPILPKEMKRMGAQAIITNAYIIYKSKIRQDALEKGVHRLINFSGPIMTDSGSFQMYQYGIDVDPIEIVEFQREIGSDIGTILDVFSADASFEEAKKEVNETIERAKKSTKIKGKMLLACTVQGSIYPELRRKCAKAMKKIDADIHPIGGVVPLMEKQKYRELVTAIIASKKEIPPSRPVHLFGAGHPLVFPIAVALGCDLFDSAAYIKYAKDGRMIFPEGTFRLEEKEELPCSCRICSKYDVKELLKMEKDERTRCLAYHNLYQTFVEMKKVREAIREGSLWEMVERYATNHPFLMDAMEVLKKQKKWLEKWERISKKRAFMYTGRYSFHRPIVYRFHKRLMERYSFSYSTSFLFEEKGKPFTSYLPIIKRLKANCIISSPLGFIPAELEDVYPVSQSVFPSSLDSESKRIVSNFNKKFMERFPQLTKKMPEKGNEQFDLQKVKAIADFQFGKGAGDALFNGEIKIIKSKKTGKIRNVYTNEKHVVSMRASDGFFTLKKEGGNLLHKAFLPPKLRIIIKEEAIPFVKKGKNVFAKFVLDCDEELRPYDEALMVSEDDELIAIGRCLMNREEMLSFEKGIAAKTREGC